MPGLANVDATMAAQYASTTSLILASISSSLAQSSAASEIPLRRKQISTIAAPETFFSASHPAVKDVAETYSDLTPLFASSLLSLVLKVLRMLESPMITILFAVVMSMFSCAFSRWPKEERKVLQIRSLCIHMSFSYVQSMLLEEFLDQKSSRKCAQHKWLKT